MSWFSSLLQGAVGVGLNSLTGGLASSIFGSFSSSQQNSYNLAAMREQNNFNSAEAAKQRQWQSQEWKDQFAAQSREWYNQFDYQQQSNYDQWLKQQEYTNAYNSPQQQVQRLNAAGMNASALAGGSNASGLAAATSIPSVQPAPPSGGAVSGSAASASSTPNMSSFGSFVDAFARASLSNSQAAEVTSLLAGRFKEQLLNNRMLESNAKISDIEASWKESFKKKEYDELISRINKIEKEGLLAQSMADKSFQESTSEAYRTVFLEYASKLEGEQLRWFVDTWKIRQDILNEEYSNLKASTGLLIEQATSLQFWNGVNADTRDSIIGRIESEAIMAVNDSFVSTETKSERIDQIRAFSDMAKYANDNKEVAFWSEVISKGVSSAANVFGEFTRFKSYKSLDANQKANIDARMRELEQKSRRNHTTSTHRSKNDDGSFSTVSSTEYW